MAKTVGFFQSFHLDTERLSKSLDVVSELPNANYLNLAPLLQLNRPAVEGIINWARHVGLVDGKNSLTPFGHLVHQYDPDLSNNGTLWLLHYYLCTDHAERSEAWYQLFNFFLPTHSTFTVATFTTFFAERMAGQITNKKALAADPGVAVRTYTRPQGLGRLGLLQEATKDTFTVSDSPLAPSALIVGYILLDGWTRRYGDTPTLPFTRLYQEPESLGRVLLASPAQVKQWLVELSARRVVTYAESQHQPVNRLPNVTALSLLERYYNE